MRAVNPGAARPAAEPARWEAAGVEQIWFSRVLPMGLWLWLPRGVPGAVTAMYYI